MKRLLTFPDPVNEISARVVAAGVVVLCATTLLTGWAWMSLPIALGFIARVASGPRFSPLGLLATRVITPALPTEGRLTPGPPKRFAQGIGATLSTAAVVAHFAFGATTLAIGLIGAILVAASLEAALGFCLGCRIFALLMKTGLVPESVCESCADISDRLAART